MTESGARSVGLLALAVDRLAAEVIGDLTDHGVHPILLKGSSIARWLYEDGTPRSYGDVDLLMDPARIEIAEDRLRRLGFESTSVVDFPGKAPWVARTWKRSGDPGAVDVHRSIQGIRAQPSATWAVLSQRTSTMTVGGRDVAVLNEAARAFHLSLHAVQHGSSEGKPLEDLRRGLRMLPRETWEDAARIAVRLEAVDFFSGGLHLLDEGAEVAAALHLPRPNDLETLMKVEGPPDLARGFARIFRLSGPRSRMTYVFRAIIPSRAAMEEGDPRAGRGLAGLVLAYLSRWIRILAASPTVLLGYLKARRAQKIGRKSRTGNTG